MGIDIDRHRPLTYGITLVLFCLFFVITGPSYEVYVDIGVNPPQNVRRTDFSWITVNEWFTTQTYIIKSRNILRVASSHISEDKLAEIVSAKRLDSADIIRISVRSKMDPFEVQEAVTKIAAEYLKTINKDNPKSALPVIVEENKPDVLDESNQEKLLTFHAVRGRIEEKIDAARYKLMVRQKDLAALPSNESKVMDLRSRIAVLDKSLSAKKKDLASLQSVYASGWPEIAKIKKELPELENEKTAYEEELRNELLASVKMREQENEVESSISGIREELKSLQEEMAAVNANIDEIIKPPAPPEKKEPVEKIAIPKGEETEGYILNPPTINFLPELWTRLVLGFLSGSAFWFIAFIILTKYSRR